jgi:lysophospholipase L1-like esterase
MKYLNLFGSMNLLTLSAILLACCKPADTKPLDDNSNPVNKSDLVKAYEAAPEGLNYALVGDTTRPNVLTPLHPTTNQTANITALKAADGSFRYVAIGASLTAGVRDGGWFNDGMTTAYPNLIARQMGLTDFKQPLFDEKEFNGYGQKLPVQNSKTPVYKAVSNNIAFKPSSVEMILSPYNGTQIDNFAVPNLLRGGIADDFTYMSISNTYYKLYLKRMLNTNNTTIFDRIEKNNFSFYSIEYYTQDLIKLAKDGGMNMVSIYFPPNDSTNLVTKNTTGELEFIYAFPPNLKNYKGIMLNVPNILGFPYFKDSTKYGGNRIKIDTQLLHNYEEVFNKHIVFIGNRYNVPVVDIKTLYEQIHKGDYVSESSKKVTDSIFFSSDGIYPSAYGQALIANECIKTINDFYKTTIPLIQTDYYLNR